MKIKTLRDAHVKDKKVILRVDFNVPLEGQTITDDTRIREVLPTIEYLMEQGAKTIIITHLGRPEGKKDPALSVAPLAAHLSKLLKKPVKKLDDCVGPEVQKATSTMQPGDVIMLENVRFNTGEETCDTNFCKELAAIGEIFVVDSFGTAHRAHASTYGIAEYLPAYAGLLMEKEITALSAVTQETPQPLTIIMGGSKIDTNFCKELAAIGEIFVVDSFGTAHRAHASTYGIAEYLPAYAGLLMEKEITALSAVTQETPQPLTIIMGGSKIDTKIGLMKNFLPRADYFLVGGGLANTFLAAQGHDIGKSLYEKDKMDLAREIMLEAEALKEEFVLPHDVIVADEIKEGIPTLDLPVEAIEGDMMILDIGTQSIKKFEEIIAKSKTIIWNGPVGVFENELFSRGTRHIAVAMANSKAKTIIGGGDTIDAINHFGIDPAKFTHVSTGGGAMLQFLEGTKLPGVEIVIQR